MKPGVEQEIGTWGVPSRGVITTLPAHELPQDALFDGHNVLVRDAALRSRPGLLRFPNGVIDGTTGTPTGAFNYRNPDGHQLVMVGTTTGIYSWDGVSIRKRTAPFPAAGNAPAFSGTLTADIDHPSRFTSIQIGGKVYLLHTNGVDVPLQWDGIESIFRPITGDPVGPEDNPGPPKPPPVYTDWTNVNNRIIGIVPPYLIQWGNLPDADAPLSQWPELNFRALSDTPDALVTIWPLGTLGAAIYKTVSIWVAFHEGQTDASAFRVEFRGFYSGPAGPQAVANANGLHLYMTTTGRIASFNGSDHAWVLDGLWPLIRSQINPAMAHRIVALYDETFDEVWFFFPRRVDVDGLPRGLLILSLPRPQAGRTALGGWPGSLAPLWGRAVTTGLPFRLGDNVPQVGVFADHTAGTVYRVGGDSDTCVAPGALAPDEARDAGHPFPFHWRPGLQPFPGKQPGRLYQVEPFMERDVNYGQLELSPVISYSLPLNGGELGPRRMVNLEERKVRQGESMDVRGRFHGHEYRYTPADDSSPVPRVRYFGSIHHGVRLE